ncbi:MAG: GNAT family N-acetyltransferase [Ruminococcus sp.]|nr:GNAT family N-acetyltransferase [Ruminococcus sp.]
MVKEATLEEIDEIIILVKLYREFYGVDCQDASEIENFIRERLTNNQSKIFIALDDKKNGIGFIQLYPSYSTVSLKSQWVLNDLYVVEQHRRKGVATALMNAVKEYFTDKTKGFILVTDKDNYTAKSFYDKNGWKTNEYDFYTYYYCQK